MVKPDIAKLLAAKVFSERGYSRYQCRSCGAYFWSTKPRNTCSDAPCSPYTFFDIEVKRQLDYRKVRELFLDFFAARGHAIIEPRPVVARWREDLYLTIASIVVFQPHVTSGLVEPPANPLVIVQPCIRLEDIDSVGLTLGRHLTNFLMGGHHAFNYPDKHVYWVNETVELAREFFVDELGVPEEEMVFKESWWEGGGNAGPCFEVAIGGLELATLVFMMYEVRDGDYPELPLKIVDTGYGIERIAWFLQRSPTAFHAIYGETVRDFHRLLGVPEPSNGLLLAVARRGASLRLDDAASFNRVVNEVAAETGENPKSLAEVLERLFDVYALLDHTKTVALMLSDGIVPSNTGEGYLARLVIRRALRRLSRLAGAVTLEDLVARQLTLWGDLYPNMVKFKDVILEMVRAEEERYLRTVSKVSALATRFARRTPSLEELIEIYDSHGIPPDLLSDELRKKFDTRIEVPPNFYSLVASRHSRARTVKAREEEGLPKEVVKWASRFRETRRLFHEDPYLRRFKAKVLGVLEGRYLVLDATAFYPEGGGQLGDRGILWIEGEPVKVLDTKKVGAVVVHLVEGLKREVEGSEVLGEIDWETRYRRMRHHTATHILLGALRHLLGNHVWQAGAEKSENKARLDVTHYKAVSPEDVEKIERLANSVVDNALQVNVTYMHRNEAERLFGLRLYQGGVPMERVIRVVEIPGWDAQACFGTHVRNTSEVGAIKITNVERIADGIIRFEFVASTALPSYVRLLEDRLNVVASKLGSSAAEVERRAEALVREVERLRLLVKSYRNAVLEEEAKLILSSASSLEGVRVYAYIPRVTDQERLRELALRTINADPKLVLALVVPQDKFVYLELALGKEASLSLDGREVAARLSAYTKAKCGGKRDHITGIIELEDVEQARELVERAIREVLKDKQS